MTGRPFLLSLALLAGCAAGPDFVRPPTPSDQRYLPASQPAPTAPDQSFVAGGNVTPDWWRLFDSPELDSAMRAALARNPTLQGAQASLRESEENLRAGYGVFYPQIDIGLSATRQRASPLRQFVPIRGPFNVFTLGATVTYLLDLSGAQRRTVESLGATRDYQRYQLSATWLTLSGNLFNAFVARAAYAAQIRATRELVDRLAEQRDIALAQANAGVAPYSSVLQVDSQLASSEAALPVLEQRHDQAGHLIATLAGSTPAQWTPPSPDLTRIALPRALPLTLPSVLVRQRPDILAAEAQLHVASANVGVASAALFPTFRIDGSYGSSGQTLHDAGSAATRFWSGNAALTQPLFHGGTLTHQQRAAVAAFDRAQASYRETVLAAFAQVGDLLTALGHDTQALAAQARALDAARQSVTLLTANYRAGLVSYLDVLVADEQLNRAQIDDIQAVAQRLQDTAALYLALGAGWQGMSRELESGAPR